MGASVAKVEISKGNLKNHGTFSDLIKQFCSCRENQERVQSVLRERARIDEGINLVGGADLIRDLLLIPKYLENRTPIAEKEMIIVVGINAIAFRGMFATSLIEVVKDEFDEFLSWEIYGRPDVHWTSLLAIILWNLTFRGWPEKFVEWYDEKRRHDIIPPAIVYEESSNEEIFRELKELTICARHSQDGAIICLKQDTFAFQI